MKTWWNNRRFTLLSTELVARVEELAEKSSCSTRTYLGELIEMACYEMKKKTADIDEHVDALVSTWLTTHRSGLPCEIEEVTANDVTTYPVPHLGNHSSHTNWAREKGALAFMYE